MTIRTRLSLAALFATAATLAFTPAAARVVQLTVNATITSGSDGGTDLGSVTVVNNQYVEHFVPGSFFGTVGGLTGKQLIFRVLYNTTEPTLPGSVNGVFDDQGGGWAFTLVPVVTVGGVTNDFIATLPGTFINSKTAKLGLTNGASDGLTGNFHDFTASGDVYSDFRTSDFNFTSLLPASFFSTDALLPGAVNAANFGFAHAAATGTGDFTFTRQTCFLNCSLKTATATFDISKITFAAVPEPATWAMLLTGFLGVGMMRRARGAAAVAA